MILIHILYIPFYSFFKIFATRSFDSPESWTVGTLSFLTGFTATMTYQTLSTSYDKKVAGVILVTAIIVTYLLLAFVYFKNDRYLKIVKKYKGTLIFGALIDIAWTTLIIKYLVTDF